MRDTTQSAYSTSNIFDARCRPWYLAAIKQRFRGTLQDAFPNNTWDTFSTDDIESLSRQTHECKAAVKEYNDTFSTDDIESLSRQTHECKAAVNEYNETFSNTSRITMQNEYDSSGYLVWTTYPFVSLNAIGLTASAVITDNETNELLAVVGIDYTLNGLSQILSESIGRDLDEYSNW
eukprot:1100391_1